MIFVTLSIGKFKNVKGQNIISLITGTGSFLFLFLYGARLNYAMPNGLGIYEWLRDGENYRYEKIDHGISTYVNNNLKKGENVLISGYFFANRIKGHSFLVSEKNSLLGNVSTYEKTKSLIQNNNIRFWIIDKSNSRSAEDVYKPFIRDASIAWGSSTVTVYDLKQKGTYYTLLESFEVNKKASYDKSLFFYNAAEDFRSIYVELLFSAKKDASIIVDVHFYNKEGQVIHRLYPSTLSLIDGVNKFEFYVSEKLKFNHVTLAIRPWRKEDGVVFLKSVRISKHRRGGKSEL